MSDQKKRAVDMKVTFPGPDATYKKVAAWWRAHRAEPEAA